MRNRGAGRGCGTTMSGVDCHPMSLRPCVTRCDAGATDARLAENVPPREHECEGQVIRPLFAELFAEEGTGAYALPMYEDTMRAQAAECHPATNAEIPRLMERGEPTTRVRLWMH
jgi:hypothetical protein